MKYIILIMLALLLATTSIIVVADSDNETKKEQFNLSNPVDKAISILGIEEYIDVNKSSITSTVDTVIMVDTITPFLHNQLNNCKACKVTLKNIALKLEKRQYGGEEPWITEGVRDFDVYLNPDNGELLKIVSTWESYYKKLETGEIKIPTTEEAERQLSSSNDKYYSTSFKPTPNFITALEVMPSEPLRADHITAMFVMFERGTTKQPAWVIESYGVESITTGHHQLKNYQLNHIRCLVDTTGNLISWSNRPVSFPVK